MPSKYNQPPGDPPDSPSLAADPNYQKFKELEGDPTWRDANFGKLAAFRNGELVMVVRDRDELSERIGESAERPRGLFLAEVGVPPRAFRVRSPRRQLTAVDDSSPE